MNTKDTKNRRRPDPKQARRAAEEKERQRRKAAQSKRKKPLDSDIVYTAAAPFALSAFLIHLLTAAAIVAALLIGMSIFFKVGQVNVSGSQKYTPWEVMEAAGIQEGDNLLTLNKGRAAGKIRTNLPYVDEVRIGIKLPKTVNIEITELAVAYAIEDDGGYWWLMDAEGTILESVSSLDAKKYTQIVGITVTGAQAGQKAVAVEPVPETETQTDAAGETVTATLPVTVTGSEQLMVACSILQLLEDNSCLGQMASVDVTDITDIQMWYADRYNILLGDSTDLSRKVKSVILAIGQTSEFQTGTLDASFTIWPDQIGYTSFEQE